MSFETAVANLLTLEGGYVNDPADPGGETNFGITKRSYPNVDIKHLTKGQAAEIYQRDFWLKNGLDRMQDRTATKMLDMVVNMGSFHPVKFLQMALCHLGQTVDVDGKLGPRTITATKLVNDIALRNELRIAAADYYRMLAAENPALRKFLNGWLRRAAT